MIAMVHAKVKNNKTKMHILIFKIINFPRLKRKIHYTNEIAWKIELNPGSTVKTNDNNKILTLKKWTFLLKNSML